MAAATSASPLCRTLFGALRTWLFVFRVAFGSAGAFCSLHLVKRRSHSCLRGTAEAPRRGPSPHPPIRNRPARRLRVCFTETAKQPPAERSRASGRVTPLRPCSLSRSLREGEAESPRRSSRQPMLSRRLPWNAASRFHFPAAPVTPSAPTAEGESSLPSACTPGSARGSREPNFSQGHFIGP